MSTIGFVSSFLQIFFKHTFRATARTGKKSANWFEEFRIEDPELRKEVEELWGFMTHDWRTGRRIEFLLSETLDEYRRAVISLHLERKAHERSPLDPTWTKRGWEIDNRRSNILRDTRAAEAAKILEGGVCIHSSEPNNTKEREWLMGAERPKNWDKTYRKVVLFRERVFLVCLRAEARVVVSNPHKEGCGQYGGPIEISTYTPTGEYAETKPEWATESVAQMNKEELTALAAAQAAAA